MLVCMNDVVITGCIAGCDWLAAMLGLEKRYLSTCLPPPDITDFLKQPCQL